MSGEIPEDFGTSPEVKELDPITLEQTCVIGSVFFKDYKTTGSEGNIRGKEALESLVHIAEKGCKAAIIVGEGSDSEFIKDLRKKLFKLGEKGENIVWHTQEAPGYSEARREAVMLARSKYPDTKAFIMQEIEKDLTLDYEKFLDVLSDNKILVMMDRGINTPYDGSYDSKSLRDYERKFGANLPETQRDGETYANWRMAAQENFGELTKKMHLWDRLNGTRIVRNQEIKIGNIKINPADLMLLRYSYDIDGYIEEAQRVYKIDDYSAAVYNMIPVLEALGLEDYISETYVKYRYPEKQRKKEELHPNFMRKRMRQSMDLPNINFDVMANIKKWKKDGKWPEVLMEAISGNKILEIRHFTADKYSSNFNARFFDTYMLSGDRTSSS